MIFLIKSKRSKKKGSSVLSENEPTKRKATQNQVSLDDVNKSAFEYFEKKKQTTYRPSALTSDDADVQFLLSLLPDLKKMTDKQKRKYKVGIINLADKILEEPVVTYTSAPLFSPTSDNYSSLGEHSMLSRHSSTAPRCETADSLSYQDISFSTQLPAPTHVAQYGYQNDG